MAKARNPNPLAEELLRENIQQAIRWRYTPLVNS
jgi:hypothetical protein